MATVWSHSRLSVYEDCRLRFRLKYVDRVKRDLQGAEAFLGSRVHEALESLYREVMVGRTPPLEPLLDGFRRAYDGAWSDDIVVSDPAAGREALRAAGEECLRKYHARHAPFRADATLGVELRVGVDLPNGARLEGFADRVARDPDGWLVVHDYKTSAALPGQAAVDRDRQLALYQAGVEKLWPGAPGVRLVWHYLRFDERRVSTRSREQMEALLRDTAALVDRIEAETDWSPTESRLCDWCPYWDLCPLKKHAWALGRKGKEEASLLPHPAPEAEAAAAALEEGLALLARRRETDAELDRVKERLLAYARSSGATRITGPSGTATVRPGDGQVRFHPRRAADGSGPGGAEGGEPPAA